MGIDSKIEGKWRLLKWKHSNVPVYKEEDIEYMYFSGKYLLDELTLFFLIIVVVWVRSTLKYISVLVSKHFMFRSSPGGGHLPIR
ncbi:hypothetical protein BLOT_010513 [Blomia tropicalis]|nr:hypothetical protein BLOT_010513 [Blomia tropicalis]